MNIEEVIKEIPEWKKAKTIHFETLSGGYSNHIYKVFVDDKIYAVRLNGNQNEFLGLRYEDEIEIMSLAAKRNITPSVLKYENKSAYLITEFIEGDMVSTDQMSDPVILKQVVELLKKIHSIPYTGNRFSNPFSLTRGYLKGAEKLGATYPEELKPFLEKMGNIEKSRLVDPDFQKHYCHNDPFNHNLIMGEDGSIKIIDWELSGIGDIWFDLATLSFSCGFSKGTDNVLLKMYFGTSDDKKHKTLHDIKYVCMIREICWALLHTAINKNKLVPGKDFTDFANSVLDRLKQGLVTLI